MNLFQQTDPHCSECGGPIDGSEEICPHCSFHPRDEWLRHSGVFMLLVAVLFTAVVLGGGTWPYLAAIGMLGVYLAFGLAVVTFVIGFMSTPARFGSWLP